jgi:hypothetical protein
MYWCRGSWWASFVGLEYSLWLDFTSIGTDWRKSLSSCMIIPPGLLFCTTSIWILYCPFRGGWWCLESPVWIALLFTECLKPVLSSETVLFYSENAYISSCLRPRGYLLVDHKISCRSFGGRRSLLVNPKKYGTLLPLDAIWGPLNWRINLKNWSPYLGFKLLIS